MRKSVANTLLCLLVLLSVGSLRCEVRCFGSAASMVMPVSQMEDATTMSAGMQHCHGMMRTHSAGVTAAVVCNNGVCGHQALPASPDTVAELDRAALVAAAVLPWNTFVPSPPQATVGQDAARPPLLRRTPLDLNSTLRI